MTLSKSAMQKLGKRLEVPGQAADADRELLEEVLLDYDAVLGAARATIDDLCGSWPKPLAVTHRLKTTDTLVQKLQRAKQQGASTNLSRIQDIAGVRVTGDMYLGEQDDLAEAIRRAFEGAGASAKVRDRREDPSYGYRAVHVILTVDGKYVEVQVRTKWQDAWANAFERFADFAGRSIRYGGPPDVPPDLVSPVSQFIESMVEVSDQLYLFETADWRAASQGQGEQATLEARALLDDSLRRLDASLDLITGGQGS